jgi:acetyl-CoA carboxylase biotin carboxyl carrier protein
MEINDIIRLMEAVTKNDLTSFKLEEGDVKLSIKKEKEVVKVAGNAATTIDIPVNISSQKEEEKVVVGEEISSDKVVASPLVGTFYNSPSPEADVYVKVGDTVKKGQTLGIIEAMKLMNEIESEYDGVVEAILVDNEDVVEYGQPLFRIR